MNIELPPHVLAQIRTAIQLRLEVSKRGEQLQTPDDTLQYIELTNKEQLLLECIGWDIVRLVDEITP